MGTRYRRKKPPTKKQKQNKEKTQNSETIVL
jgi:hypothetical protein